jgi:hypothetical protein
MMTLPSDIHLFGIRHHGPGSAHALRRQFEALAPDAVLVEGPPDANALIHWLGHAEMEPPVALIVYRPDQPRRAAMFPFAVFSPELQAIRYGLEQGIPVRFMDLPQAHLLAVDEKIEMPDMEPLRLLSEAAGYDNYEHWWNQLFEQREDTDDVFHATLEAMQAVRKRPYTYAGPDGVITGKRLAAQREAHMRQYIRAARAEGCQRIAVICGAWHAPALIEAGDADHDAALLAGLPEVKVEAVWVPWTYSRLSSRTGYGAGITSPGWYHHLWEMRLAGATPSQVITRWLSRVADLLRQQGFDSSPAHVIEAVRLAEALAALREMPIPGLPELNEATQAVMCFGDFTPMRLIQERLIVGERMGAVPPGAPMTPLQRDLLAQQRRLRLRQEPTVSTLNLDLRTPSHLERSHLLHRLRLLNIPWGKKIKARGKEGTFREVWKLQWLPDFAIRVIEANVWGNTVQEAVEGFAADAANKATNLAVLTQLLDDLILAELPDAVGDVMKRIADQAAISSDVPLLMASLTPLARVQRYGSVRQLDRELIEHVVDGLLARICVGLPTTCTSMDDAAALEMFERVNEVNAVVRTLHRPDHTQAWHDTLMTLADQGGVHGLLAGRASRLLLDGEGLTRQDATQRLELAVSARTLGMQSVEEIVQAGFWIEGFLKDSGMILLHDQKLWNFLSMWVKSLGEEGFIGVLPLLRRTFTGLGDSARRQIGERVKSGKMQPQAVMEAERLFDEERAAAALPLIRRLLGLQS